MSFLQNSLIRLAVVPLAGLSILLLLKVANAFDQLTLSIDQIASPTWQADQLSFTLDWQSPAGTDYQLEVGRLELTEIKKTFTGLKIGCQEGEFSDNRISCHQGKIHLSHPMLDKPAVGLMFELEQSSGKLSGQLKGIAIAGGRMDLDLSLDDGEWRIKVRGQQLNLESVTALLPAEQRPLADWSYAGLVDLDAQLAGQGEELRNVHWQVDVTNLAFADTAGAYAGEGLGGRLDGKFSRSADHWQGINELFLTQGELLTPAFYLNPASHPLRFEGRFTLDDNLQTVAIRDARLHLQGLLELKLQGNLDLAVEQPLEMLRLQVQPFQAGELYQELFQPVLVGTPWGRFEMAGEVELSLGLQGEAMDLDVGLTDFHLDDTDMNGAGRRMGLYGVNGRMYWGRSGEIHPSWLEWQAGHLLEHIELGPSRIDFQVVDESFSLSRQVRVPVLDGFILVDRLDIESLGEPEQKLLFDGVIEPISMDSLSEALGWVPLSGKLSGMIPGLTYENGLFRLEGILLVRMFDGDILIKNLKLQDLFGIYPQLYADIEIDKLDLDTLTSTFSFGEISGRLDGYIRNLRLEDWQPVTFDARFYTPENDKSRRRISQRAVDNISNLGGAGLSGSLARSFLGVFEEFRYKRIGIGCRLQDGDCEMVGVGKAKQGYYLVEGSGIPRIDIIGYNKTADWTRLVEQLKQITESGAPVIQ